MTRDAVTSGAVDVRINNGPVAHGELTITHAVVMVESPTASKPDLTWEYVDDAGHFHAYALDGELPTLQTRRVHKDCPGGCRDDECEGYDVTVYSCRICGRDIEPKRVPDYGPKAIPGRCDWSVKVRTYVQHGETVSVRLATPAGEFFGVAEPINGTVSTHDGATTVLAGHGPLGQRRRPPKCTCPLIPTSAPGRPPTFALGDPAGCKVHGRERDAQIEAAKRQARGEVPDPFYVAGVGA